ncbi:cupin-like domain-containing protein [Pendulispora rubella]|uniref:Cupin-like domain-containing protein n=1 Tax=Pendulispora rubella TaxID=2741070 RepID=A0ABZ2LC17_9BACT
MSDERRGDGPTFSSIVRRSGLSREEFDREYREPNLPVVMTDALTDWPALGKWTLPWFEQQHGNQPVTVDVSVAGESYFDRLHRGENLSRETTLGELIREIRNEPACQYYLAESAFLDSVPELFADIPTPRYHPPGRALTRRFWLGPANTVSGFHQDSAGQLAPTCILFAQIYGRKRVVLASPDQSHLMYPARASRVAASSLVDLDALDDERFPLFREARLEETIVGPGDMLFIPERYWHYLRSLEPSISLSNDWNESEVLDLIAHLVNADDPVAFAREHAGIVRRADIEVFPGGLQAAIDALRELPQDLQELVTVLVEPELHALLAAEGS